MLQETALSMRAAQTPQPQEDISPRPLQIPKRESEHHLPDLPQIGPQPQGAVGGSCAMNPPSLSNMHCGGPIRQNREEAWQHLVRKHCTDRVPRSQCHTSNSRDLHHVLQQIEQPTLASPPAMNNSPWHWHNAKAMPTLIGRRGLWGCAGATSCELDVSSLNEHEQNHHGPNDNPRP